MVEREIRESKVSIKPPRAMATAVPGAQSTFETDTEENPPVVSGTARISESLLDMGPGSVSYYSGWIQDCGPWPSQLKLISWFNPANRALDHGGGVALAHKQRFPQSCDWVPAQALPDGTVVRQAHSTTGTHGEVVHCCFSAKSDQTRLASEFYDPEDEIYLYRIL